MHFNLLYVFQYGESEEDKLQKLRGKFEKTDKTNKTTKETVKTKDKGSTVDTEVKKDE